MVVSCRSAPLGLALVALLLALGCGRDEAGAGGSGPPESREAVVEIVEVQPELLRNLVDIPGQLTAELTVVVKSEIEGVLETIGFSEGERVEARRVLFRLRNDAERARLREAEASLALAEATWRRTRDLARRNVSSTAQLERATAERAVARARVEAARVALEKTVIRAPFDGLVGALLVAPGDQLDESKPLTRIDAVDRLQLVFTLPEIAVGVVRAGIPVEISVAPFPGESFPGEIYFVSPTLDPEARRMLVKAWVPNADHRLRPGLFAEIEAEVERKEQALLVPESALLNSLDGSFLWRVDAEQRVERVPVRTGLRQAGRVEIVTGLAPGDRVVAAGIHKLDPGARVRTARDEGDEPRETAEDPDRDRGES